LTVNCELRKEEILSSFKLLRGLNRPDGKYVECRVAMGASVPI